MMTTRPYNLFYLHSNAEQDKEMLARLDIALSRLKEDGFIQSWHSGMIRPGYHVAHETNREFNRADLILLLLSSDLLAATGLLKDLMRQALERNRTGQARVVPILLRHCDWEYSDMEDLRILPANQKPISVWGNKDAAFLDITRGLRKVVYEIAAGQAGQEAQVQTPIRTGRKAVILTALPVEQQAVVAHLINVDRVDHPNGTIYRYGQFQDSEAQWQVAVAEIGMGNPRAALEAERAIEHFSPSVVLFVGVAGGIKDVQLGDVVAATKIYGYEFGKDLEMFQASPDVGQSTYPMQQIARYLASETGWQSRLPDGRNPQVRVGPMASGEKVVASTRSATYEHIRRNYSDALAVEMEGHGFLTASHANPTVNAMVLRGIFDLLDDNPKADAEGFQRVAAQNAAAFAFTILANLRFENR